MKKVRSDPAVLCFCANALKVSPAIHISTCGSCYCTTMSPVRLRAEIKSENVSRKILDTKF